MTSADRIRQGVRVFDFVGLFNALGWDNLRTALRYDVDGAAYTLSPVAEKRGYQVYECAPAPDGSIPPLATRTKIERLLTRDAREHLLVFVNRDRTVQHWQWVRREPGKPLSSRSHVYYKGQDPEALVQKLERLRVSLDEEERIGISDVTQRAQGAFNTERVTKRFYDQFKLQHEAFRAFITGITEEGDKEWYASLMLNRLMFVYFIQSKGFLASDMDYLPNRLARMQQTHGKDQFYSFYRTFLLVLFHQGFAARENERTPDVTDLIGDIPYLNGGLFELHEIENRYSTQIQIPDAAFEAIFAFFREWDWHLDTRPERTAREINPDVLGYIFEKFINQKQMGAYYTKEDITGYISQNTIIPWLFDRAKRDCEGAFKPDGEVWRLLVERPDNYIYPAVRHGVDAPLPEEIAAGVGDVAQRMGWNRPAPSEYALPTETWREHIARRQRCLALREKLASGAITEINDLITENLNIREFAQAVLILCEGANLLEAFYDALESITVLDPTCGSGAFLFAALELLAPLYDACIERMTQFVDEANRLDEPGRYPTFRKVLAEMDAHPNREYFITKKIIVNNLYGVDIMAEATEICKLRLFLTLAAQIERAEQIEPLPDIDFNIRAGNTLVGLTGEAAVEKATQRGGQMRLDLDGGIMDKVRAKATAISVFMRRYRDAQTGAAPWEAGHKAQLQQMLAELRDQLDHYLAAEYGIVAGDMLPLEYEVRFAAWRESHQPFHWYSEFYGIMQGGGFDVIIGNPPYVSARKIEYAVDTAAVKFPDIYANVALKSLNILQSHGRIAMIVPLSICFSEDYSQLRRAISSISSGWFVSFDNIPAALFEGVSQRCTIWIGSKHTTRNTYTSHMYRWRSVSRTNLFQILRYTNISAIDYEDRGIPKLLGDNLELLFRLTFSKRRDFSPLASKRHSAIYVKYGQAARNFVSTFLDDPPCINATSLERTISNKIGKVTVSDEETACAALASLAGDLFFWYWLVRGDGFDVTQWLVKDYMDAILRFSGDSYDFLVRLGQLLRSRRYEALVFKNNAGLFVGNYNYRVMSSVTRRADLLCLAAINYDRNGVFELFDYVQGILSINTFAGEKAIPVALKSLFPPYPFNEDEQQLLFREIDGFLLKHYGFTEEELDYIINYDIKYRMGADTAEDE